MDAPSKRETPETDVLHFENRAKLSPEEIAKAVARHIHHHPPSTPSQTSPTKPQARNKFR